MGNEVNEKSKKARITIEIDESERDLFRIIAEKAGHKMSSMIRVLIREEISRNQKGFTRVL